MSWQLLSYLHQGFLDQSWHRGVVVITNVQLHSTKSDLWFGAGSNHAHGMSEICDGENL